jgi:hypothetical protein
LEFLSARVPLSFSKSRQIDANSPSASERLHPFDAAAYILYRFIAALYLSRLFALCITALLCILYSRL